MTSRRLTGDPGTDTEAAQLLTGLPVGVALASGVVHTVRVLLLVGDDRSRGRAWGAGPGVCIPAVAAPRAGVASGEVFGEPCDGVSSICSRGSRDGVALPFVGVPIKARARVGADAEGSSRRCSGSGECRLLWPPALATPSKSEFGAAGSLAVEAALGTFTRELGTSGSLAVEAAPGA